MSQAEAFSSDLEKQLSKWLGAIPLLIPTTWKLMFFQTKSDTLNTSNPNLLPFGNVECGLRNRNQVDLTINTNRHVEIISPLEGWRFTNTT